ncbi:type IV pilin-like G/H family protein [Microcoleus sp. T3_B1]|uniref:type IV pilin-like G/H family protein n=1 Tax=Microcoleus sp. T3_B1 TaxID=3055425 RepID=UPI002FD2A86E
MTNKQELIKKIICDGGKVLLICMFIALIDLPSTLSYLSQRNKAKESEAKMYVGSMNRAQQALLIEKSAFATSVNALGLGIKTETTNYKYSVRATKQTAFNYGVSKQPQLKSYVGGVFLVPVKKVEPNAAKDGITTISIFCQADSPGTIKPAEPTYQNGESLCGKGTTQVTR